MPQLVSDGAKSHSSGVINNGAFKFRLTMFGVRSLIVLSILFGIVVATAANDLVPQGVVLPLKSLLMITVGVLNVYQDTIYGFILFAPRTKKSLPSWLGKLIVLNIATIANALVRLSAFRTLVAVPCAVWQNFSSTTSSNSAVLAIYFQYYAGWAISALTFSSCLRGDLCGQGTGVVLYRGSTHIRDINCLLVIFVWMVCSVRTVTYVLTMSLRLGSTLTPLFLTYAPYSPLVLCVVSAGLYF